MSGINALRQFARRAEREPYFCAHWLARHRQRHGITEEQQAQQLGIDLDGLIRLALCGAPRPEQRQEDLEAIARHVGTRPELLAAVVKESPE